MLPDLNGMVRLQNIRGKRMVMLWMVCLCATAGNATPAEPEKTDRIEIPTTRPNSVRLYRMAYVFSFAQYYRMDYWNRVQNWGISYSRQVGKSRKHGWSIRIEECWECRHNWKDLRISPEDTPLDGVISWRDFTTFEAGWRYALIRQGHFALRSELGLNWMAGNEGRLTGPRSYTLVQRDPGVFGALDLEYQIFPWLHAFASASSTLVLWRYQRHHKDKELGEKFWAYEYLYQTPRTWAVFRIGLGYSFGKGLGPESLNPIRQ